MSLGSIPWDLNRGADDGKSSNPRGTKEVVIENRKTANDKYQIVLRKVKRRS